MDIRKTFKEAIKKRSFMSATVVLAILTIINFIFAAFSIRPNDLQVPLRYSAFGITNIYREQWYHEFVFVIFALAAALGTYIIALKLFSVKSVKFATGFLWLMSIVMTVSLVMTIAVFRVISVVQ